MILLDPQTILNGPKNEACFFCFGAFLICFNIVLTGSNCLGVHFQVCCVLETFVSCRTSDLMATDEENARSSTSKVEMEETSPLLFTAGPSAPLETKDTQLRCSRACIITFLVVTCINLSAVIFEPAQARIFESAYCLAWYEDHDPALISPGGVPEVYCKIPRVQRDVASLIGTRLHHSPLYALR